MSRVSKILNATVSKPAHGVIVNAMNLQSNSSHIRPRRDRNVSMDATPDLKSELMKLAQKSGLTLSDYMRAVAITAVQKQTIIQMHFTEKSVESGV